MNVQNGMELTHEVWRQEHEEGMKVAWVYYTPATIVVTYYEQGNDGSHSVRHEDIATEPHKGHGLIDAMLGARMGHILVLRTTFRV